MKNKNTLLIILLAAVLAFVAAFLIFIFSNKKPVKPVENTVQNQQETTLNEPAAEQIIQTTEEKPEEEVKEQPKPVAAPKVTQKKQTAPKTAAPKPNKEALKPAVQKETISLTAEIQKEEEGVVIPVKYTSKNTYKYVYTPARYRK